MQKFCEKCGAPVVENQMFCQRCGNSLPQQRVQQPEPTPEVKPEPMPKPVIGSAIKQEKAPKVPKKKSGSKLFMILTIVFGLLMVVFATFGVLEYLEISELNEQLADVRSDSLEAEQDLQSEKNTLQKEIDSLNGTISTQQQTIDRQGDLISDLESDVESLNDTVDGLNDDLDAVNTELDAVREDRDLYETVVNFLQESDCGYAAKNFRAFRPVYVLHVDDEPARFTVTADFAGAVTISFTESGNSADCYFTESSYNVDTPVEVKPLREGITYLNFKNTVNDDTFRVMILVLE